MKMMSVPTVMPPSNGREELVAIDEIAAVAEDDGAGDCQDAVAGERIELLLPVEPQEPAHAAQDRGAE